MLRAAVVLVVLFAGCAGEGADVPSAPLPPADVTPPEFGDEASLRVTAVGRRHLSLAWPEAADDDRVAHYRVVVDGRPETSVRGTNTVITGLEPGTHYALVVQAVDRAGNRSLQMLSAEATTVDGCGVRIPVRPRAVTP